MLLPGFICVNPWGGYWEKNNWEKILFFKGVADRKLGIENGFLLIRQIISGIYKTKGIKAT